MKKRKSKLIYFNKRAQVTIFIIIAVIIVVLGILIYMFYPKIKVGFGFDEQSPSAFLESCIKDEIQKSINILSLQGGSINPNHYILYNGGKIEYLCYTEEYYKTCVMQQPMLKSHIENEIKEDIEDEINACLDDIEKKYKSKGYNANLKRGDINVELLPKRIIATLNSSLTLTKSENSEKYNSFRISLNNNLYELLSIANSILNWEARYGDAETTTYMNYYHDLKVEKLKQTDGSTIYILTDRNNGNKFQFASRSVAWPPGYGTDNIT